MSTSSRGKITKTLHCAFLQGKTGILACQRYGSTALSYEQVRDDTVDKKHYAQVYFVKYYINTSLPLFLNYIACTNIVSETHRVMKFSIHLVHIYIISLQYLNPVQAIIHSPPLKPWLLHFS